MNESNHMYMVQRLIGSRVTELALLDSTDGRMFDICGRMSSEKLSEETHYSSYLVYRLSPEHGNINFSFRGVCRFVDNEGRDVAERRVQPSNLRVPVSRDDGWLEVEIGTFFNVGGNRGDVESCVCRVFLESGKLLIVREIEFRPEIIFGGMSDWGFSEEFLGVKANF
ncbi:unnamed protein product [Cuscuta europaea]|nr:unnamed protein product [Cuscuta europaea]